DKEETKKRRKRRKSKKRQDAEKRASKYLDTSEAPFKRNESSLNTEKTIDRSAVNNEFPTLGQGSEYMPFSSVVVNMEEVRASQETEEEDDDRRGRSTEIKRLHDLRNIVPDVYDTSQETRTQSPTVPHSNTELSKSSSTIPEPSREPMKLTIVKWIEEDQRQNAEPVIVE
ncbi:9131_t:CDS:2, partial [Paraglomus brasilianum]